MTPGSATRSARYLALLSLLGAGLLQASWDPTPDGKTLDGKTPLEPAAATPWPYRIPASDARGYDVLGYRLELEFLSLPPQTSLIEGVCHITLRLLEEPPPELRFDLVDQFSVTEILRDGLPASWTHAGDSLRVALPSEPRPGAEHLVTIAYTGSPPRHGPFGGGLLLRRRGVTGPNDPDDLGPTVGNVSQPYSSHGWFPCKDHPSDKATFELSVIAPDTLAVVATGRLLETVDLPGCRRRWDWATAHPVATYLVGLAVAAFTSWGEECGDVPLEFHVFAEHLPQAEAILEPTCAMLRWLENLLGPYPFPGEKYAQAAFGWSGAMENQTVTLLGQTILVMPPASAHLFVVHELAHHWFGNSLTPSRWRDIWLNEGFARYHEALWLEHTEGRQAYHDFMARLRRPTLFVGDGLLGDPDPILPNFLIYDKGAWVLHMLRHELQDPLFFAALRDYAQDTGLVRAHTDRVAMTAAFSRTADRDLSNWLSPWLDTDAVPELGVRWHDTGGGRTRIEVVQQQGDPFFPLTVPLRVHCGADSIDMRLPMKSPLASRTITTTAPIDSIRIDPDDWLLRRTSDTPPPRLRLEDPRPNPAGDSVELVYWLEGADRITAAVYDARGRLVLRTPLGLQQSTGSAAEGGQPLRWSWDGHDGAGRRAAGGLYWMELRTSRDRAVGKVVLVR